MKSWFQGSQNRQVSRANETSTWWCSIPSTKPFYETSTISPASFESTAFSYTRSSRSSCSWPLQNIRFPLNTAQSLTCTEARLFPTCASSRLCAWLSPLKKILTPHLIAESVGPRYWRATGNRSQILPRLHSPSFRIQPSGVRLWARNRHSPGDGKSQPLAHASFRDTDPPKSQKVIAGRDVYALYGHLSAKSVQYTYKGKVGYQSALLAFE
jgi:hypothetical protein